MLVLHLVPNGVGAFHSGFQLVLDAHLVEGFAYGLGEVGEQRVALLLGRCELALYGFVLLWVLVTETEVFKFGLYFVQSETVGERRVDVERLSCYLVLLVGGLRREGAHVVQTVAYLDEYDANVVAHGEQQLLKVLCLCRCLLAEDAT